MKWHIIYGKWWMVQWQLVGWFGLGIHIEPRKLKTGKSQIRYGPYIDIHFFCFIFSLGYNPYYSTGGSD